MYSLMEKLFRYPLTKLYALKKIPGLGNLFLVAIGSLIMSIGISAFLLNENSNLVVGVGGLSRIIEKSLGDGETAGWIRELFRLEGQESIFFLPYWALSVTILLIGGLKKKEKEVFILKSFVGVTMVSFVFFPIFRHFGFDSWALPLPESISWISLPFYAIVGALLLALGISITISAGGSTCGPDLIAVLAGEHAQEKFQSKFGREKSDEIKRRVMRTTMRIFDASVLILGILVIRPDNAVLYAVSVCLTILVLSSVVVSIEKLSQDILRKPNTKEHDMGDPAWEIAEGFNNIGVPTLANPNISDITGDNSIGVENALASSLPNENSGESHNHLTV